MVRPGTPRYGRWPAHAGSHDTDLVAAVRIGIITPGGKRVGSQVVETNARCLIEAIRQVPEPRHICLEEGTLSGWVHEVLSPAVYKGRGDFGELGYRARGYRWIRDDGVQVKRRVASSP